MSGSSMIKWTKKIFIKVMAVSLLAGLVVMTVYFGIEFKKAKEGYEKEKQVNKSIETTLSETKLEIDILKNEDQYKANENLISQIEEIKSTFKGAVDSYEDILNLEPKVKNVTMLREKFAVVLHNISEFNYASASASIKDLTSEIEEIENQLAKETQIPQSMASVAESSSPPESGYSRQKVVIDVGEFIVSIVSADLSSTRVIIGTASDGDCKDNCPVKPLAQYVSENGAYAGINGTYFCPATYPDCANKKNSFDLLVMNKNKTYFNSENNIYSNNPAVIFGDNYVRFVNNASQWGRDTSVTGVISNYPLLLFNKEVVFGGDGDPKKGSKGNRSFVSSLGNKVYVGVVHNATVAESALVMKALGMDNAMNLDNGGSTALWSGGYKVGPGRELPNVILFVRK